MPNLKLWRNIFFILCLFSFTSCVEDIDLQRTKEINIGPTIMLDLIDFKLSSEFLPAQEEALVVKHEVDLEFLPNNIGDNLQRLILQFKYQNSLPRPMKADVIFFAGNNETHRIEFQIEKGGNDSLQIDEFSSLIEDVALDAVLRSTRLVLKIEAQPGPATIGGQMNLKSRAFYEFDL